MKKLIKPANDYIFFNYRSIVHCQDKYIKEGAGDKVNVYASNKF